MPRFDDKLYIARGLASASYAALREIGSELAMMSADADAGWDLKDPHAFADLLFDWANDVVEGDEDEKANNVKEIA